MCCGKGWFGDARTETWCKPLNKVRFTCRGRDMRRVAVAMAISSRYCTYLICGCMLAIHTELYQLGGFRWASTCLLSVADVVS